MKLTKKEIQLILDERQKELEKPIKEGFLKHDLYLIPSENFNLLQRISGWTITKKEKDILINDLDEEIRLDLPKGTRFYCYLEKQEECWYDSETGTISGADAQWAEKHLYKIKTLKRK